MFAVNQTGQEVESKLKAVLEEKEISYAKFRAMMGGLSSQTLTNWFSRGVPHKDAPLVAERLNVPISRITNAPSSNADIKTETLPTTVEEYLALYGDKWRKMPPEELTKLMNKLTAVTVEAISKSKK